MYISHAVSLDDYAAFRDHDSIALSLHTFCTFHYCNRQGDFGAEEFNIISVTAHFVARDMLRRGLK